MWDTAKAEAVPQPFTTAVSKTEVETNGVSYSRKKFLYLFLFPFEQENNSHLRAFRQSFM